ncbi:MAG: efflux RND transporter periplasmic adaptor subunit [Alphaproteobacteria bacterium]|nr:efflux RND transporter periplasmic adaptor subunit [Alphaproteobacteria bacterium]
MTKKLLYLSVLGVALFAWQLTPSIITSVKAETEAHDGHGHDEADSDDHSEDHNEEGDSHDEHGHDSHEKKDSHDEHGHGDEHDEHEEGKVEISPDAAKLTGIQVKQAGSSIVAMTTPLTGRIVLNENKTANVRARFPGFVKAVHVNLGESVKKGQKLASVESNESLRVYNVVAPMDGVILSRETNIGDVTNGKELFVIADLSTVWAKYHIFPRDVSNIKKGQPVTVHTLDEKTRQNAEISMLFPTTDALSQTVIAIAELPNADGIWRPGMTIEGDIKVGEKQASLAVPRAALQFLEEEQVVFIKSGNEYEPRPVTVGMVGTENVEITSGLKRGETYVSAGSFVIKADILKGTAAHEH